MDRRASLIAIILLFITILGGLGYSSIVAAADQPVVYVVPIKGEINEGQTALVLRSLKEAGQAGAAAVIFEIDTFGGKVDAAVQIRDAILSASMPTVAFVKNRAWSAGALITIANQYIAVSPSGSIGAAEPIPATEKTISALKAEFAATAERRGRTKGIAEAMVDKTLGYQGLVETGKILSLTAEQAKQHGYADIITDNRSEILALIKLEKATVVNIEQSWSDKALAFLNSPIVQSLLIAAIFLTIMIEIKTAGVGIAAAIGISAAALFFVSQFMMGVANWLEVVLFLVGIGLIIFEISVPGGFVAGLMGVTAIFASFFLAMGGKEAAVYTLLAAFILALVIFPVIARKLPRSKLWDKIVLKQSENSEEGYLSGENYEQYMGQRGVTLSYFRPAGIVNIDGHRLDAISEGAFIAKGAAVEVVQIDGYRIIVREIRS